MLVQHTWKRTKAGATYVEADGAGNEHDIAVQRGMTKLATRRTSPSFAPTGVCLW